LAGAMVFSSVWTAISGFSQDLTAFKMFATRPVTCAYLLLRKGMSFVARWPLFSGNADLNQSWPLSLPRGGGWFGFSERTGRTRSDRRAACGRGGEWPRIGACRREHHAAWPRDMTGSAPSCSDERPSVPHPHGRRSRNGFRGLQPAPLRSAGSAATVFVISWFCADRERLVLHRKIGRSRSAREARRRCVARSGCAWI